MVIEASYDEGMAMERYSIGIYKDGSLHHAYVTEPMTEHNIEAHLFAVRAAAPAFEPSVGSVWTVDAQEWNPALIESDEMPDDHIDRACALAAGSSADEPGSDCY